MLSNHTLIYSARMIYTCDMYLVPQSFSICITALNFGFIDVKDTEELTKEHFAKV